MNSRQSPGGDQPSGDVCDDQVRPGSDSGTPPDTAPASGSSSNSGTAPDSEPAHDPTGLGLAKTVAGAVTGPRRRRRNTSTDSAQQRRTDAGFGGAHPDDRDPQRLGNAMDRFIDDRGWSTDVSLRVLLGRWPTLVGGANAAHSMPAGYRDGVLIVQAESTVWATSLRAIASQLVARLNNQLGDGTVTRVEVRGPQAPNWNRGRRTVRGGRGPRDTYG